MRITRCSQRRIARLRAVDVFAGCTPGELAHIERLGTELEVRAGSMLQREGGRARAFCVIVEGDAVLSRRAEPVARLVAGGFFGEDGVLDRGPDSATIVAATPMTLLVFGPVEFEGLLVFAPAVARTIMRALVTRAWVLDTTERGRVVRDDKQTAGALG